MNSKKKKVLTAAGDILLWSLDKLEASIDDLCGPLEFGEAVDFLLWGVLEVVVVFEEDMAMSVKESWLAIGSPSKLPKEESCCKVII